MRESTEVEIDRIIRMAREERTTFDVIKYRFGTSEVEVIRIMRACMKPPSFATWRTRVHGRKTKHGAEADKGNSRFASPNQRLLD